MDMIIYSYIVSCLYHVLQ